MKPERERFTGLEAVFMDCRPELLRRARAMGVVNDAEDVLQDVWLKIGATRGPVANPRSYLIRMLYTAVLDRHRIERRAVLRDDAWLKAEHAAGHDAGPSAEAEQMLVARQTLAAVEARLADLGEPTGTIFRRHKLDGQTLKHIAAELGMGLSTVEKHVRKVYAAILPLRDDA